MTLPLSLAEKLQTLVDEGQMPASKLKHAIVDLLLREGVLAKRIAGRTKVTLYIPSSSAFEFYVYMKWGITNLRSYIYTLKDPSSTRADLVEVGSDSKTVLRRSFKGFLVNC